MTHSASKDKMKNLKDASGKWVVRDDVAITSKVRGELRKGGLTIGYTGLWRAQPHRSRTSVWPCNGRAQNLANLARDIRKEFNSPGLPMVIGELGNDGAAKAGSRMQRFRDAQKRGAEKIDNALFVMTHDFARPRELSPNKGHGHHWYGNAESYFLVGDALGKGMKRLLSATEKK